MDQVHVIRHKVLVEGLSRRRVAAEMGVSRNTVRKYLEHSEPVRCSSGARQRPVYERVVGRLESLKEEWTSRTTAKQRVTAPRLHRELRSEGYEVSLTVVQDWHRRRGKDRRARLWRRTVCSERGHRMATGRSGQCGNMRRTTDYPHLFDKFATEPFIWQLPTFCFSSKRTSR